MGLYREIPPTTCTIIGARVGVLLDSRDTSGNYISHNDAIVHLEQA